MTESEIVYQISELYNRSWSIQQWWASISIGLLIPTVIASEKLNLFLVAVVASLYSAFTFHLLIILDAINKVIIHYNADLKAIEDSAHKLASGTLASIEPVSEIAVALNYLVFVGTYLGCTTYFIYSYIRIKRGTNA